MPSIIPNRSSWCPHEYSWCVGDCPIDPAERRLREAHRHWHTCLNEYQSPDDFQIALNSSIQALRNVTFVLQSAKKSIPGFDDWYAAEQNAMRSDAVLRWVVEARNSIVKKGDLETKSHLSVKVVTGYRDESDLAEQEQRVWEELDSLDRENISRSIVSAPALMTIPEALERIRRLDLPLALERRSQVTFERMWIADSLPTHELLSVLAHAHGKLRQLLSRCHELLGLELVHARYNPELTEGGCLEIEPIESPLSDGKLPCMSTSRSERTARVHLVDGSDVEIFSDDLGNAPKDPDILAQARKKFGPTALPPASQIGNGQELSQVRALVAGYANTAKGVILSGEYHAWFSFYFNQGRLVHSRIHASFDVQGNMAIATEVTSNALQSDADLVIMIGEIWYSRVNYTVDGAVIHPESHPDRQEALVIDGLAKSGAASNVAIPFQTIGGEHPNRSIELEEARYDMGMGLPTLDPLRRVWGLKNPARGASFFKR